MSVDTKARLCGTCGLELDVKRETGIRHFGFFESHSEYRCIQLLQLKQQAAADEVDRLKADQADWRKGVKYIASCIGYKDGLSCVDIAHKILEHVAKHGALLEAAKDSNMFISFLIGERKWAAAGLKEEAKAAMNRCSEAIAACGGDDER